MLTKLAAGTKHTTRITAPVAMVSCTLVKSHAAEPKLTTPFIKRVARVSFNRVPGSLVADPKRTMTSMIPVAMERFILDLDFRVVVARPMIRSTKRVATEFCTPDLGCHVAEPKPMTISMIRAVLGCVLSRVLILRLLIAKLFN